MDKQPIGNNGTNEEKGLEKNNKKISSNNKYKKAKIHFKQQISKISKKDSIHFFASGYLLLIGTFAIDNLYKNSEKLINTLFNYLGNLRAELVLMFFLSILIISFGKYIMRKNHTISFLDKFFKYATSIDIFIVMTTVMLSIVFLVFKISVKFNIILLLNLFVWLMEKPITAMLFSVVLVIYILFIAIELFETIAVALISIINKIYEEIQPSLDRYTLLIAISTTLVSLIALMK